MLKNKTQKITFYVSRYGLKVYEVMQYNRKLKDWFIVGDCSTNGELKQYKVNEHNYKLI